MQFELWLIIIIIALLLGAVIQAPWVVFSATILFIILLVSRIWRRYALHGIEYSRSFAYSRGFPDETIEMNFNISNASILPVPWVYCEDTLPSTLIPDVEEIVYPTHIEKYNNLIQTAGLRGKQKIVRKVKFSLKKRGVYRIGPVEITSSDFLGFNPISRTFEKYDYITIFPAIHSLEYYGFKADDPFGLVNTSKRIFEDPINSIGIREYHPEDELKKIHWPATAKTSTLQVKMLQPISEKSVVICMNASTTKKVWEGTNTQLHEYNIELAASILHHLIQKDYSVGLLSNSSQAFSDQAIKIMPGKSVNQLSALLVALAGSTQFITGPFESFLLENASRIPYGSSLIIITSIFDQNIMEVYKQIGKYRINTSLIFTGDPPPVEVTNISNIYYLPEKAE